MSGHAKPYRLRQRLALICAFLVWVEIGMSAASGQSDQADQADVVVADVVVTPTQNFPVAQIDRKLAEKKPTDSRVSNAVDSQAEIDPAEAALKSTFVFSSIELRPIRPSVPPAEPPLPPKVAARREVIERQSMARIFAAGMITDIETTPKRRFQDDEIIVSDILVETSTLPEPPLVGERIEELAKPGQEAPLLPAPVRMMEGMLEDDNPNVAPRPIVVDELLEIAPEPSIGAGELIFGQSERPSYSMPDGGLDIYRLAPTRFFRPLPNAR